MRKRNRLRHKVLVLSLLTLVGVMTVSASPAQAKWIFRKNGETRLKLELVGELLLAQLSVPDLGLDIHCAGGEAEAKLELNATHTVATGTFEGTYVGCQVVGLSEVCDVRSNSTSSGQIYFKATGSLTMEGEKTFLLASSSEIAHIEILGVECPYDGVLEKVNGTATLNILNPLNEMQTHTAEFDEEKLFFGTQEMILLGDLISAGVHRPQALAHMEEKTAGHSWAIQLTGL